MCNACRSGGRGEPGGGEHVHADRREQGRQALIRGGPVQDQPVGWLQGKPPSPPHASPRDRRATAGRCSGAGAATSTGTANTDGSAGTASTDGGAGQAPGALIAFNNLIHSIVVSSQLTLVCVSLDALQI